MVKELYIDGIAMPLGKFTMINIEENNKKIINNHGGLREPNYYKKGVYIDNGQPKWKLSVDDALLLKVASTKLLSRPCVLEPQKAAETEETMFCLLQTLACVHCPSLESLRVPVDLYHGYDFRELKDPAQIMFPNLTAFSATAYVEEGFYAIGEHLTRMLANAPRLERCLLQGIDGLHLNFNSASIKELYLNRSGWKIGDSEQTFPHLPNLESFIYQVGRVGLETFEEHPVVLFNSLQRNCKKLRRIGLPWDAHWQEAIEYEAMDDENTDSDGENQGPGARGSAIQSMSGMSSLRELILFDGCTAICYVQGDASTIYKRFFPPLIEKISFIMSDMGGPNDAPPFALAALASIARVHYPHLKLVQTWAFNDVYNKEELEVLYRDAGVELRLFTFDNVGPDLSELLPPDLLE